MTRPISEYRLAFASLTALFHDQATDKLAVKEALDELEAAREQIRVLREALARAPTSEMNSGFDALFPRDNTLVYPWHWTAGDVRAIRSALATTAPTIHIPMTDPKTPERMKDDLFEAIYQRVHEQYSDGDLHIALAEARRAREAEAALEKEVHHWRTARTHGSCHEDLRAEIANRVDAEDERDALRAERDALREALKKAEDLARTHGGLWGLQCHCGSVRPGVQIADAIAALPGPDVYSKPSTVNHPASSKLSMNRSERRVDPFDRPGEGEKT